MAQGMAEAHANLLRASTKVMAGTASNVAKRISQIFRLLKSAMTKRMTTCAMIWITRIVVYADRICRMSRRTKTI